MSRRRTPRSNCRPPSSRWRNVCPESSRSLLRWKDRTTSTKGFDTALRWTSLRLHYETWHKYLSIHLTVYQRQHEAVQAIQAMGLRHHRDPHRGPDRKSVV